MFVKRNDCVGILIAMFKYELYLFAVDFKLNTAERNVYNDMLTDYCQSIFNVYVVYRIFIFIFFAPNL